MIYLVECAVGGVLPILPMKDGHLCPSPVGLVHLSAVWGLVLELKWMRHSSPHNLRDGTADHCRFFPAFLRGARPGVHFQVF